MGLFDAFKGNQYKAELEKSQAECERLKSLFTPEMQQADTLQRKIEELQGEISAKENEVASLSSDISKKNNEIINPELPLVNLYSFIKNGKLKLTIITKYVANP